MTKLWTNIENRM
jgi:hypothetical protein